MLIRRTRGWKLRESELTPEAVFLSRRKLIKAAAAGSMLLPGLFSSFATTAEEDPSTGLYPAKRNPRYALDRPLTEADLSRARADPVFRQRLLQQSLDALLGRLQKERHMPSSVAAKPGQMREGVTLAVRLAELIQTSKLES